MKADKIFTLARIATYLVFCFGFVAAGNVDHGYTYEKPAAAVRLVSAVPNHGAGGHHFGFLPTVQPLPPVPALPPLPTPRGKGQITQTQSLFQTHPVASFAPIQKTYLPSGGSNIGRIAQQYQSPALQSIRPPQAPAPAPAPARAPAPAPAPSTIPTATATRSATGTGFAFSSPGPSVVVTGSNIPNPAPAPAQPLRVPFGKQAIVSFPGSASASSNTLPSNGRQLKQYAVVEIIDNDIEQNTQPFLTNAFFDSYRATFGATGTGAAPAPLDNGAAIQFNSRAGTSTLQQQQGSATDAVALGSGGLGFIRLANGNVYLGSGSLGYISGQQHTQSINEARTRTGAPKPDPLHFGHGPLGGLNRFNRFLFRF